MNIKSILIFALAFFLTACSSSNEAGKFSTKAIEEKISPSIHIMIEKLAQPSAQSFDAAALSSQQVKVDAEGNIQCYVHLSDLSKKNIAAVKAKAAKVELMDETAKIIQAWIPHHAIPDLAALQFVTKISPPDYGRPLSY